MAASWSNILHDQFPQMVNVAVFNEVKLLTYIERKEMVLLADGSNNYLKFPVNTAPANGIGSVARGGNFPAQRQSRYVVPRFGAKMNVGTLGFDEFQIQMWRQDAASKNGVGAFRDTVMGEILSIADNLRWDENRQLFGDGSGKLCQINEGTPSNPYTVDNPGITWMQEAMACDVIANAAFPATIRAGGPYIVDLVDPDSSEVKTSAAVTAAADNDWFVRTGNANIEMDGFGAAIGTAAYANVDPAVDSASWKSYVEGTVTALLESHLLTARTKVVRRSGVNPPLIVTGYELIQTYAALFYGSRQWQQAGPEGRKFAGGYDFDGLALGNVPLTIDAFCEPGTVYFFNLEHIFLGTPMPGGYEYRPGVKAIGGAGLLPTSGKDEYTANSLWIRNIVLDQRNCHAALRGKT